MMLYISRVPRNIEEVVRFPDLPPRRSMAYGARQLVAREVEMEKVRRAEAYFQQQQVGVHRQ